MRKFAEVAEWCAGAVEAFGDPSAPVGQLFLRWQNDLASFQGDELACGMVEGELVLLLGPGFPPLPIPVQTGEPLIERVPLQQDELMAYGAEQITFDVWAINPSLNVVGLIHAFMVLHGVPSPAPWERRIVLP